MNGLIADIIISVILIAMVSGAILYIHKEKKKGRRCIGCPMAGSCTEAYKQMEADMRKCLKKEEL